MTTFTPATPFFFLLVLAVPNFIIVMFNIKYNNIFKSFPGQMSSKIRNLRHADLDHFYQYVTKDSQYQLFLNLNKYLEHVLGTRSISDKMYREF